MSKNKAYIVIGTAVLALLALNGIASTTLAQASLKGGFAIIAGLMLARGFLGHVKEELGIE